MEVVVFILAMVSAAEIHSNTRLVLRLLAAIFPCQDIYTKSSSPTPCSQPQLPADLTLVVRHYRLRHCPLLNHSYFNHDTPTSILADPALSFIADLGWHRSPHCYPTTTKKPHSCRVPLTLPSARALGKASISRVPTA